MKDILRLTIVLTVISAVSALSLAVVYKATQEPIAQNRRLALLAALNEVLPPHDNQPDNELKVVNLGQDEQGRAKEMKFYPARQGGKLVGAALTAVSKGFGGDIEMLIGVNGHGQILGIKILSHRETPGLGAKIIRPDFLQQFAGKTMKNQLDLKKAGGEIDQITGASVSSKAVVQGIKNALEVYQQQKG